MPVVTALAIYFVVWWMTLFVVLPWGIRGQHEEGRIVRGSEPGAPSKSVMKKKFLQNTILAAIIWFVIMVILKFNLITIDNIPFFPDFVPKDI